MHAFKQRKATNQDLAVLYVALAFPADFYPSYKPRIALYTDRPIVNSHKCQIFNERNQSQSTSLHRSL